MFSFVLAAALLAPGADPAPAVAMVVSAKGHVTLERDGGNSRRLGTMDLLRPGDRLRPDDAAEVVMMFLDDGHRERLKANAQVEVGEKGCKPADAVEGVAAVKLPAANLAALREMARSGRGAVGAPRGGDKSSTPEAVTPIIGAAILTERPELSWPPVAGAQGYRVEILLHDGGQGRVLWRAETKEPRLPYPEKHKPLAGGLGYRWRVTALLAEDKEEPAVRGGKFFVLSPDEVEELAAVKPLAASKDPAEVLLAAMAYEASGAHGEALAAFERLAALAPEEGNYQTALASYYERAGRKDDAAKARERAQKLGAAAGGK
jgi:hypothetical protein